MLNKTFFAVVLSLLCLLALVSSLETYNTIDLGSLRSVSHPNFTTVSGISSGAYFAVQAAIDFSSGIIGAGVIAGGPFYCAKGQVGQAVSSCMVYPGGINVNSLVSYTNDQSRQGTIDPVQYMKSQKAYVYSGTKDSVVYPQIGGKLMDYYKSFMTEGSYMWENSVPSEHAWINNAQSGWGNACDHRGDPFINVCPQKNIPYEMLNFLLNNEALKLRTQVQQPEKNCKETGKCSGTMYKFSQRKYFAHDPTSVGLDVEGFVYVPATCEPANRKLEDTPCKVHFSFHGCKQGKEKIEDVFAANNDLNMLGAINEMIVVYPQAHTTGQNPNGCWDWWGYSGSDYALKSGAQPSSIKKMMMDMGVFFRVR